MPVIESIDLSKTYSSGTLALDDVSLQVDQGQIYGLLGENGAGKTTLINILTGQIKPDSGSVSVLGIDPSEDPALARTDVGILPEKESPMKNLKPSEHFQFVGDVRGMDKTQVEEKTDYWISKLELGDKRGSLNEDLSRGQQQKVMFASTFLHEPDLVFIDEPMVNLDPKMQAILKDYIREYNRQDKTIVLSTHYVEAAMELCDEIGVMMDGRIVEEIHPDEDHDTEVVEKILSER
jgi:ABC-2 type transport system ATP-binding protein